MNTLERWEGRFRLSGKAIGWDPLTRACQRNRQAFPILAGMRRRVRTVDFRLLDAGFDQEGKRVCAVA